MTLETKRNKLTEWVHGSAAAKPEIEPILVSVLLGYAKLFRNISDLKKRLESRFFFMPPRTFMIIIGSVGQGFQLELRFPDDLCDRDLKVMQDIDSFAWRGLETALVEEVQA